MDREYVGIRQATQKGYIECEIGGVADFSYPTSKLRRGRVQGGAMYALHLHPKAWGFVVLKELFGGGRTVCSIATISRKGVQKWQR